MNIGQQMSSIEHLLKFFIHFIGLSALLLIEIFRHKIFIEYFYWKDYLLSFLLFMLTFDEQKFLFLM